MDLHNNRRIGDCHPILLLLSTLIFIYKIIHIHILTPEVFRRFLVGVGELPFFSGNVPDHQDSIVYDLFFLSFIVIHVFDEIHILFYHPYVRLPIDVAFIIAFAVISTYGYIRVIFQGV